MVNFFDRIYASIKNNNKFFEKIRYYAALRFIIRICANNIIPIYFSLTRRNKLHSLGSDSVRKDRIIVSLTTFPSRINRTWMVIETMLRQTRKPDKLILWLSKEQFASIDSLPQTLLKQRNRGLEIEFRDSDLGSHKKYYYMLQEFSQDIMITVDDDIFYPTNTIEELIKWHEIFPNTIIARYGAKIKVVDNLIAPYVSWDTNYQQKSPDFHFFGSGGGTLFPAHSLPKSTLNKEIFMDLCFGADDIWLNTMCRLNHTKIYKTKMGQCSMLPVINKNNISLHSKNLGENNNDQQLRNIRNHFISILGIDPYLDLLHSCK